MERLRNTRFWGPDEYNLWLRHQEVDPSHVFSVRIFGHNHRDISNISRFTNLVILDITGTGITEIPEVVYTLSGLQTLVIRGNNNLTSISENIGNLTNLSQLIIDNNEITILPRSIGRLTNLRELFIYSTILNEIPDEIFHLPILDTFHCNACGLRTIPEGICNLVTLRTLKMTGNYLTEIPASIDCLTNLERLIVNDNQITQLSDSIGNLRNLLELNINNNQITALPDSIGNLRNLNELYASNNFLTSLPDSIGNLVHLDTLVIRENNIERLPDSFAQLREIGYFDRDRDVIIPEGFHMHENNNINTNNNNANNNEEPIRNYNNLARVGRAFQIHEAFDRIDKTALKQYFIEHGAVRKTFDTNEAFIRYLNETFRELINALSNIAYTRNSEMFYNERLGNRRLNNIRNGPGENVESAGRNFETIYNRILSRVNYSPEQQELFSLALEFTKGQPQEFIQNYVSNYINDTLHAYNGGGNTISCAKGAIERIITSLVPAAMLYVDTNAFREDGYDRLVSIITRVPMGDIRSIFNAHSQECYEAHPEDVAAFRECIKGKARGLLGNRYNNAAANEELGPLINSLGLYGGKRRKVARKATRRTRKGRRVARKAERKVARRTRRGRRRQNKGAK